MRLVLRVSITDGIKLRDDRRDIVHDVLCIASFRPASADVAPQAVHARRGPEPGAAQGERDGSTATPSLQGSFHFAREADHGRSRIEGSAPAFTAVVR
jgi:hypothetical protein